MHPPQNREIYLDNAATTAVHPDIADRVREIMVSQYGNPSSLHKKGVEAELLVTQARKQLGGALRCKTDEIVFTSGGTEANHLALAGAAEANRRRGNRIVSTAIEHTSVLETLNRLEKRGFETVLCPAGSNGSINPDRLAALVTPDTILVSVMAVNNEIGSIQPLAALAAAVKAVNPALIFHTDAVQAFGKIPFQPDILGMDLAAVSAHKLHGPKGVGLLFIKTGTVLESQLTGGGQERELRSGTENVPGIAGFGMAAEAAVAGLAETGDRLRQLKLDLVSRLHEAGVDFAVNGPLPDQGLPQILSLAFPGVRGEVLTHFLEARNIFVSTGSACHSRSVKLSHVLKALNLPREKAEGTIRISLSARTTPEDIELTARALIEALARLRPQKTRVP
ncbi:MAG: cysteine desulfurase family protein [Solirubrobacterales bacterium]